ncbi:hypothetical protein [Bosea lathyri]|uniref:Uncharacterized protein n=1 Tax=Bosea lathyri TaxID=1036778 RepID=A0A1H6BEQ3_9HYPH|nr:hypothetical protein [Bosea lathyri]SEG59261.1 hypothetical protein SAMN04488115_107186 [Bosea lathyri]
MSAGLQIINDAGTVQIDETYKNLCFRERRAISLSHSAGNAYHDIVITGRTVLVAMQSQYYAPFLLSTQFDGTNWTYRWGFTFLGAGYPSSGTAYLWIFDDAPPNPDSFGFEVYDAAGELIFQSNAKVLKISGVRGNASGFAGAAGRVLVPLILEASIYPVLVPVSGQYINHSLALLSAANAISPVQIPMSNGFVGYRSDGVFAAVDVTGYA